MESKVYSKSLTYFERLKVFLRKLECDQAVSFGILTRIWSLGAGPLTALLIATRFTPEIQGYYYTFANILTLQLLLDLGFGTVILQFVSHEWSKLNLNEDGNIVGDEDALFRLISIARMAMKWYLAAAAILVLFLCIGGYLFFSYSPSNSVKWEGPWLLLCLLTSANFCLIPVWALLEGCNQVKEVYTFRFYQGLAASTAIWVAILLKADLWAVSISTFVNFIWSIIFLKKRYHVFLKTLLPRRSPNGPRIDWRTQMLPMQWRFTISVLCNVFLTSLYTPFLFKFYGPVIAGQMGMTWSLISVLGLASSWLAPKTPQFGILVAQKKYRELDLLFWKLTKLVFVMTSVVGLLVFVFVVVLQYLDVGLARRILPPLPTGLLLLAQCLSISSTTCSMYMRAHKKEPIMPLIVLGALLNVLFVWILGKHFAVVGVASSYLLVMLIVVPSIFVLFFRFRKEMIWQVQSGITD